MEPLKISLCAYLKNPDRKSSSYYARMRKDGKTVDIPLHTKDKGVAESWVRLRRDEIQRYNDYVTIGEEPPSDLLSKLPLSGQKQPQKASISLRTCYESWEVDMRRKGLRERSIDAYMKNVRLTVPLDEPLTAVTKDNVRLWLSKHDHLKSATRKHYSVSLHEFVKFLVDQYGLDPRIASNWLKIRVEQAEKGYWRMNEIYHIIEAVRCQNIYCEAQFKAFCWVMAVCGSRQNETGLLKWSDYRDGTLTFRSENTKTHKTRIVPLDMRVCHMLDRLPHRGDLIFSDIPPSQPGRFAILSKAIARSGMPKGGLHTFRHSACMYLYARCNDIKAVAQLLGQSPAVSLQWYAKARQSDELRNIVQAAYESENMIPSTMDELIKAGLV